jgi:hypothetical protein
MVLQLSKAKGIKGLIGILFIVLIGVGLLWTVKVEAAAEGTTYYVNNKPDSSCSNEGTGMSQEAPWCDFDPINVRSFEPGDEILLARGAQWNQELRFDSKGMHDQWIRIGAYGEGERPKIIRNGHYADRGLRIMNPSFLKIEDLEVGYAGAGIYVYFSTLGNEGLHIDNIYVHHNTGLHQMERFSQPDDPKRINAEQDRIWTSSGILITGNVEFSKSMDDYAVRDVRIENIEGTQNQNSVSFDWMNGLNPYDAPQGEEGAFGENLVQDVVLKNLYLYDDNNSPRGCDDGLRIINASRVVMMNAVLEEEASCHSGTGTAAVLFGRTLDVNVVNSVITDTKYTGSSDMVAIDYECCNEQVNIRNSYFARNAGGALSLLAIYSDWDKSKDHTISGNVFVDNGPGSVRRAGRGIVPSGVIMDNLYNETLRLLYEDEANFNGFKVKNNLGISQNKGLYYAAADFLSPDAGNAWSYEVRQVGAESEWTGLVYDPYLEAWIDTGSTEASVDRFSMRPGSGEVARVWTAPQAGTIDIRGLAVQELRAGDSGAEIAVTHNGHPIVVPQAAERLMDGIEATETNSYGLNVAAGDVLRFEVHLPDGGHGSFEPIEVSWTPAIAYTSIVKKWEFKQAGNSEGWTAGGQNLADGENLRLTLDGTNESWIESEEVQVPADHYGHLQLTIKNATDGTQARVYFTTDTDPQWDNAKSVSFRLSPGTDYREYVLNLYDAIGEESDYAWAGTINRLRIDFGEAQGIAYIDRIVLGDFGIGEDLQQVWDEEEQPFDLYNWEFRVLEDINEWTAGGGVALDIEDDQLRLRSVGGNPYILSPEDLYIPASSSRYVKLQIHNENTAASGKLFFITDSDTQWSNLKSVPLSIPAGSSELVVDMAQNVNWRGIVTQLRFDPTDGPADMSVGHIRISSLTPAPEHQPYYAADWTFDTAGDLKGWQIAQGLAGEVKDGHLALKAEAGDPYMVNSHLKVDASKSRYIHIRMKGNVEEKAVFYFVTNNDPVLNEVKTLPFDMKHRNGEFVEYVIDTRINPNWKDIITFLRFDPGSSKADFEISFIRITSSEWVESEPYSEYEWKFDRNGDTEGWVLANMLEGETIDGSLRLNSTGNDPYLVSSAGLSIDTMQSSFITLRMKSDAGGDADLFFSTDQQPGWNGQRSVNFQVEGDGQWHEYRLIMKDNPGWKGIVTQLRLDPISREGHVEIDKIRVSRSKPNPDKEPYSAYEWKFDTNGNTEGWTLANMLEGETIDGAFRLTSTGNDPYLFSPAGLAVDTTQSSFITIRMKSNVGGDADIFFSTDQQPGWSGQRSVNFQVDGSGEWTEYKIYMKDSPLWEGIVTQLRLDPISQEGHVEIDSIRVMTLIAPEGDVRKPEWPEASNLSIDNATQTSVRLSWPAATDHEGVTGYRIFVDGAEVTNVADNVLEYQVTGLAANTRYTFVILAYDAKGNESIELSGIATTLSYGGNGSEGGPVHSGNSNLPNQEVGEKEELPTVKPQKPIQPSVRFADIAGHWAKHAIEQAVSRNIVSGYPDGSFGPNRPISRAEFIVMLTRELQVSANKKAEVSLPYADTDKMPNWAKAAVIEAISKEWIRGYEDQTLRLDKPITRAEMIVILSRAVKLHITPDDTTMFSDDNKIAIWAKPAVAAAERQGFIKGKGGNRFAADDHATRAEAIVMLLAVLDGIESSDGTDEEAQPND